MARRRTTRPSPTLFDDQPTPKGRRTRGGGSGGRGGGGANDGAGDDEAPIALHEAAQARYLNYSLSVITSRALPDVRDGLKPVQRRILYSMGRERMLTHTSKPRKCANVVG